MTNRTSSVVDSALEGFAVVPYIQGVAEPISRVLNKCGIKVALKPFRTLSHIFAKPKDLIRTVQKTHAVYAIPCGDCGKEYLGQTKRQFGTRLRPGSHMSQTIGELLSVTIEPENSQKILCIDSCEQLSSPTIATYENQA